MNNLQATSIAFCAALAAAAGPSHAQSKSAGLEPAPSLPGAELTRAELLKRPHHKVAEPVKIEGHLGRFVIDSKFGKFSIQGANLLAVRVSELPAIEELLRVRKDSAFTDAPRSRRAGWRSSPRAPSPTTARRRRTSARASACVRARGLRNNGHWNFLATAAFYGIAWAVTFLRR